MFSRDSTSTSAPSPCLIISLAVRARLGIALYRNGGRITELQERCCRDDWPGLRLAGRSGGFGRGFSERRKLELFFGCGGLFWEGAGGSGVDGGLLALFAIAGVRLGGGMDGKRLRCRSEDARCVTWWLSDGQAQHRQVLSSPSNPSHRPQVQDPNGLPRASLIVDVVQHIWRAADAGRTFCSRLTKMPWIHSGHNLE